MHANTNTKLVRNCTQNQIQKDNISIQIQMQRQLYNAFNFTNLSSVKTKLWICPKYFYEANECWFINKLNFQDVAWEKFLYMA